MGARLCLARGDWCPACSWLWLWTVQLM